MSTRLLLFLALGVSAAAQSPVVQQAPALPLYNAASPDPWPGLSSSEGVGRRMGNGAIVDSHDMAADDGPAIVSTKPSAPAGVSIDQLRHPLTDKAMRLIHKAQTLIATRDFVHAREELRKAVKDRSAAPYAHSLLGQEYLRGMQFNEAVDELQLAVQAFPSDVPVHANLGYAFMMTGQNDSAEKELRRALQLQPKNPRTHLVLGMICYVAAHDDEAREHFEFAAKELPTAHLVLARFYRLTQHPDASDREFQTFVRVTGLKDTTAIRQWLETADGSVSLQ